MSDNVLYTLLTAGVFAVFYLFVILPIQLRAKRQRHKTDVNPVPKQDWYGDLTDPHYETINKDLTKQW